MDVNESKDIMKRNSSIELFRILATILVLIVHLNGWMAGGLFDWNDHSIPNINKYGQIAIISLSCVCVNCFLIISGWFGIKLKFSTLYKIWCTLFSIYVPFYLAETLWHHHWSYLGILNSVIAFSRESYFVQNYVMLLFIAPLINLFYFKYNKKTLPYIIVLVCIEFLMEFFFQNETLFINHGYSLFHFVTMYMIGRVLSLYKQNILCHSKWIWLSGYILCAMFVFIWAILDHGDRPYCFAYSNPIVILESLMLFFPFLYFKINSRMINKLAQSSFSVYIIQVTAPVGTILFSLCGYYVSTIPYLLYAFLSILFSLIFYLLCTFYDNSIRFILNGFFNKVGYLISKYCNKFFIYND